MAHPQQLQFIKSVAKQLSDNYSGIKVLDIGSYDVNGTTREFFDGCDYVGVDLTEGPGVDIIGEGDKLTHPDETYDIALSCECFEHNPNWAGTFLNMWRMTKKGGVVLFTCATTGRPEHGTTRTSPKHSPGTQSLKWDYYRNLSEIDFQKHFEIKTLFSDYFFMTNESSSDLYFVGLRRADNLIFPVDIQKLKNKCQSHQTELQCLISKRKKKEKFIPKPLRPYIKKILNDPEESYKNPDLVDFY